CARDSFGSGTDYW
nr:immunoglobulin heavy chain junction region [Macaca mulatta]